VLLVLYLIVGGGGGVVVYVVVAIIFPVLIVVYAVTVFKDNLFTNLFHLISFFVPSVHSVTMWFGCQRTSRNERQATCTDG
jgi:hypothetical protein